MDIWAWIVIYAVGLTLLQLLVYRYLINSGGSLTRRVGSPFGDADRDSSWRDHSPGSDASSDSSCLSSASSNADRDARTTAQSTSAAGSSNSTDARPTAQSTGRHCPHCGAMNEPDATFSRCWNCARAL